VLRGVADDYNGLNSASGRDSDDFAGCAGEDGITAPLQPECAGSSAPTPPSKTGPFQPEWQRVLPLDKELRACLRWMWLREGWVWDCLTGAKRRANEEEMENARKGEMKIDDEGERKFAAAAAGAEEVG
jgi:hypothetical protein